VDVVLDGFEFLVKLLFVCFDWVMSFFEWVFVFGDWFGLVCIVYEGLCDNGMFLFV